VKLQEFHLCNAHFQISILTDPFPQIEIGGALANRELEWEVTVAKDIVVMWCGLLHFLAIGPKPFIRS
jgi:hypothetical protein